MPGKNPLSPGTTAGTRKLFSTHAASRIAAILRSWRRPMQRVRHGIILESYALASLMGRKPPSFPLLFLKMRRSCQSTFGILQGAILDIFTLQACSRLGIKTYRFLGTVTHENVAMRRNIDGIIGRNTTAGMPPAFFALLLPICLLQGRSVKFGGIRSGARRPLFQRRPTQCRGK